MAEEKIKKQKKYIWAMVFCGIVFFASQAMIIHTKNQYRESRVDTEEAQVISGVGDMADIGTAETPSDAEDAAASRLDAIMNANSSGSAADDDQGEDALSSLENDRWAVLLSRTDIAALKEVNGDVLGWICIPDTLVNYPLMKGKDNDFYLNHTWKGKANAAGSIFMECQCSPDFTDFNTIIYGHRMSNTSMFGALASYKKPDFWEAHRSVYICLDDVVRRYDIFASFEPKTTDCTFWINYTKDKYRQQVVDFAIEESVIDCGITPDISRGIITLSTCTGNGHATRWVVQAVLAGEMKKTENSESLRSEDTM